LLEDHVRRGTIALAAFFWRRVLRLYPALVVLIAAVALSSLARPEVDASRVWLVVVSNLFYFSNWVLAADTRAWAGGTAHTWSLAVEVHFYVGWALLLAFGTRRWGPGSRRLLGWAAGIAVASALWRIVVWDGGAGVARAYTSTDTRCDALFLGAAAALLRWQWLNRPGQAGGPPLSRPVVWGLELAAATVIVWWIATTADKAPAAFLGGFGLVGGMSAVLILTTLLSPHSLLAAPLSLGVLVWFGHISYSLYLWHLPVAKLLPVERLARHGLSGWMATAVCVLLSTAIAAALRLGSRFPTNCSSNLFLSPLAGYTNLPMRVTVRSNSAGSPGPPPTSSTPARCSSATAAALRLVASSPQDRRSPSSSSAACRRRCATPPCIARKWAPNPSTSTWAAR
jgi:peptidoglycan/LPS O-acetylase OafA/YrhL